MSIINKTSSFKLMINGIVAWAVLLVICIGFLIYVKQYIAIPGLIVVCILGWSISFLSWSRIADLQLHEEHFCVVTFFKKIQINYKDIVIHDITRWPRPLTFVIHSNMRKINLGYTKDNLSNIEQLLKKIDSQYDFSQFETLVNNYNFKPL